MNEESKHLPSNESIARLMRTGGELGDLAAHHEITLWGLMLLLAEIGAAHYVLIDKLREQGALDADALADINETLGDPVYRQGLYVQMAQIFHDKCERVEFAALHPEEVTKFVEDRNAGENPEDPMGDEEPSND